MRQQKVSVFGVVLLMVVTISWTPLGFGKGLVLICLLLISGPLISHRLASAAYHMKILLKQAVRDDLNHGEYNNTKKDQSKLLLDYQEYGKYCR